LVETGGEINGKKKETSMRVLLTFPVAAICNLFMEKRRLQQLSASNSETTIIDRSSINRHSQLATRATAQAMFE